MLVTGLAILTLTLIAYIGVGAALYLMQRRLLYRPTRGATDPTTLGLAGYSSRRLEAADGTNIVAWFSRGERPQLILYLHGKGGSLASRTRRLRQLASFGPSVLAIDYRGFGGSSGQPTQSGLIMDAEAAHRFAGELGFPADQIVVLGESLGTGVAVSLAVTTPIGALALVGGYSSVVDIAADRYRWFPVRHLLRDGFDAAALIGKLRCPTLIMHGSDDRLIPIRYAERLVRKAPLSTVFLRVDGAGHRVLDTEAGEQALRHWLERLAWQRASRPRRTSGGIKRVLSLTRL